jgi:hypothetical protein
MHLFAYRIISNMKLNFMLGHAIDIDYRNRISEKEIFVSHELQLL